MSFASWARRSALDVERRFSDCWVEIGNSVGWASILETPDSAFTVFDPAANLRVRGVFESYNREELETEGLEISVSICSLIPINGSQYDTTIMHDDRLMIEFDGEPDAVKMAYRVRNSRPDGRYRTLLYLHILGPVCPDDMPEETGYALEYPFEYGGNQYAECVPLNELLEHRK